jgi:hypothetical protein
MELLQKQQEKLAEKIRIEQERQEKLNDESSIERLGELINPITQSLDFSRKISSSQYELSRREQLNMRYEQARISVALATSERGMNRPPQNKFDLNPALACEEIFVTLLNIIKKQEARIQKLESIVLEN